MSVDFANAVDVSANAANAVVEERNRCTRMKRQQVQIPGAFLLMSEGANLGAQIKKRRTAWHFVCHCGGLKTSPCVDVGQRGVVLRLISRIGR